MNYNLQIVAIGRRALQTGHRPARRRTVPSPTSSGGERQRQRNDDNDVTVHLLPGGNAAHIGLLINGITQSNTIGVTSQASIYTSGTISLGRSSHCVRRQYDLDWPRLKMTYVQPSNQTTGALDLE